MPSDQDDLPDVLLVFDTIVHNRQLAIAAVMNAFFAHLASKTGYSATSFKWHYSTSGDINMHFEGSRTQAEVDRVHKMWIRMRDKYPTVLIVDEWRKLRETLPQYARLGAEAFASAFSGRARGEEET